MFSSNRLDRGRLLEAVPEAQTLESETMVRIVFGCEKKKEKALVVETRARRENRPGGGDDLETPHRMGRRIR